MWVITQKIPSSKVQPVGACMSGCSCGWVCLHAPLHALQAELQTANIRVRLSALWCSTVMHACFLLQTQRGRMTRSSSCRVCWLDCRSACSSHCQRGSPHQVDMRVWLSSAYKHAIVHWYDVHWSDVVQHLQLHCVCECGGNALSTGQLLLTGAWAHYRAAAGIGVYRWQFLQW